VFSGTPKVGASNIWHQGNLSNPVRRDEMRFYTDVGWQIAAGTNVPANGSVALNRNLPINVNQDWAFLATLQGTSVPSGLIVTARCLSTTLTPTIEFVIFNPTGAAVSIGTKFLAVAAFQPVF
jgi:hypothetical protein